MKWILVSLNIVVFVGLLLVRPMVRNADLGATQSVIQDLEQNQVLDPVVLAKYMLVSNPGANRTPERRLAAILHHGRGASLLLFMPALFLLLVNAIVIAVFWRPEKKHDNAAISVP